jgi:tRNA G18 (ribose-2'-O)-methylase SpoU
MGPVVEVEDPDDPRLTDYRSLTDVALRTRVEPPLGLFIAEGALVIERALAAGYPLRSVLVSPRWLERTVAVINGAGAAVYVGSEELLAQITGFHVHRGALAAVHRRPTPTLEELVATSRRLVLLEDLVNHTNLGAIFRAAAALGIDGVVLSPSSADPLYRRSVRVSMGAVFVLPYARATSWPGAIDVVRAGGFEVFALTPAPGASPLDELQVGADDRLAVLLGTEGRGLSDAAIGRSDRAIRIPMAAGVDSLNVASAAAVAFWVVGAPGPRGVRPRTDRG